MFAAPGQFTPPRNTLFRQAWHLFQVAIPMLAGETTAAEQFTETGEEAGLRLADPVDREHNTGGIWIADINNDGWPDIYATRLLGGCELYVNQQDGTFLESAATYGLEGPPQAHSALFGDIDNDGDTDLFLGLLEGQRHFLYLNNGNGTFEEQAKARDAALDVTSPLHRTYGGTWADYDSDGYLDLHLPEWFNSGVSVDSNTHSVLLRNLGSASPGFFENATQSAGVAIANESDRQHAFASAFADIDQDGWADLLVTGDFGTSRFFRNRGNGTFEDATASFETNKAQNAMGIAVGDLDGDHYLDYFETSIFDNPGLPQPRGNTGNRLYQYRPELNRFSEVSSSKGVRDSGFGWGTTLFDCDNDGDLDLLATNATFTQDGSLPEKTKLWINDGSGNFTDEGEPRGIFDDGNGYGVATLDYDRDGDLDILIGQKQGQLLLYRNDSAGENAWLRIKLQGTLSNRDAIGAKLWVETQGDTPSQYFEYNPTNLFMAQAEAIQHIGLGPEVQVVSKLTIRWPSGTTQTLTNLHTRQLISLTEPAQAELSAPTVVQSPQSLASAKGESVELSVSFSGNPKPSVQWFHNGTPLAGANSPTLTIENLHPHQSGNYRAQLSNPQGTLFSDTAVLETTKGSPHYSTARWWNELLLDAIRKDFPAPTVHARNLYHTSAAMWDAYWAFEPNSERRAKSLFHSEPPLDTSGWSETERLAVQEEAISYAAYRVLTERYQASDGAEKSLYDFTWLMGELGYDPTFESMDGPTPAALGNRIAASVLTATLEDGSNESNGYADPAGYTSINAPLAFATPGTEMADPDRWQPLAFEKQITQNGIELDASVQEFVGSHWGEVTPFAIDHPDLPTTSFDPGPPPLLANGDQDFVENAVEVIRYSSFLDPNDDTRIDISPSARFNNPLGSNAGTGTPLNPATGEPYPENYVKLADYGRVLAEFWADGPSSETPPGHWNALFNQASDHPQFETRLTGNGLPISRLKWDVISYLALNGAMHDAAISAWGSKRDYDYSRPISMIRYLAQLGQSTDPDSAAYHPNGLPLVDDLIELVTDASSASGQRHEHLSDSVGQIAIKAWRGQPEDPHTQSGGVGWLLAREWIPYQRSTFVTPAFAAYVSGHSCFSRAGAEVLTLLTGSPYFPGGMGEYTFPAHDYLEFESGPSETLTLQWATYYDAADQAGLSRLYGGIHVSPDDLAGRHLGSRVGLAAFLKTQNLMQGETAAPSLTPLQVVSVSPSPFKPLIAAFQQDQPTLQLAGTSASENATFKVTPGEDSVSIHVDNSHEVSGLTTLATNSRLDIRFTISDGPAQTLLFRTLSQTEAWPTQILTTNKSTLSLYSSLNDEIHPMAQNENWRDSSRSSLIQTAITLLPSASSELSEFDAALFQQLEAGEYLLRVEAHKAAATHLIEIRRLAIDENSL
ncbi:FG-GAP-like repeat-containing protein [Pelagicoccus enzymogenes]|uniref:FG-GAP-like repeat-containing protein n=1 Tax=Pelagicoccus enzymogenes TaxID=2773457 RepID=UPI0028105B23|nr:FG-GAP-like repeat-containing protein [Pelagicoccus enzymogenes]MDQ8199568.1 FG-GAP-like repeat-containing protein [Pelagicoccus enzymogenes]